MPRKHIGQLPALASSTRMPLSARAMRVAFARTTPSSLMWVLPVSGTGVTQGDVLSVAGGSNGSVRALVRAGQVEAYELLAGGSGYTDGATVSLSGGTGTGVTATVYTAARVSTDAALIGCTDIVWHYTTDAGYVTFLRGLAARVQGTLSGQLTYTIGNAQVLAAATLSFDQQPVPVGFLIGQNRTFGAAWRAGFRAIQGAAAQLEIDRGMTSVQYDDPASDLISIQSVTGAETGGSWDPETMAAFSISGYLATVQGAGITQRTYSWATQAYTGAAGNWATQAFALPNFAAYYEHLKNGIRQLHQGLRAQLGERFYSLNAGDPFPKANSTAWMVPLADGVVFESESAGYSGAQLGNAERYTRLWVNIKTVQAGGGVCVPHLRPVLSDSTNAATRAQQVQVLKQQIALCYALGARPTYPYDTFQYPWSGGTNNSRWFASVADGLHQAFQMVRDFPELFDGAQARNAMLLAYDVDQDSQTNGTILTHADVCLRNGIPAAIYALGTGFQRDPALEAAALRVVRCSTGELASQITGPNVINLASFATGQWQQYRACSVSGTATDVFCVPRIGAGRTIVHLVNFDGVARAGLSLTVAWWALQGLVRAQVLWYEPGATAPRRLASVPADGGLQVPLPSLAEWGVVVVETA